MTQKCGGDGGNRCPDRANAVFKLIVTYEGTVIPGQNVTLEYFACGNCIDALAMLYSPGVAAKKLVIPGSKKKTRGFNILDRKIVPLQS